MPNLTVVERDYGAVADQWAALGPLVERLGATRQERLVDRRTRRSRWLAARNGRVRGGAADGRPSLERAEQVAEAILALSGVDQRAPGRCEGFRSLEERCGVPLADLAEGARGDRITFQDAQVQPRRVITSPEWSGIDEQGRALRRVHDQRRARQAVAHAVGRMHLYLDHAWMLELGEGLPAYRPPLDHRADARRRRRPIADDGAPELTLRYLTPHSKWSIHSEYQDNLHMLTLFRGGSGSVDEPAGRRGDRRRRQRLGRGATTATASSSRRAVVSHRVPAGHVPDVPLQGPPDQHAAHRDRRAAAAAPRTR